MKKKPLYTVKIQDFKRNNTKVSFKVVIKSLDKSTKRPTLFMLLCEDLVCYEGSDGKKEHRFVVRDYIPDERGIELEINLQEMLEVKLDYSLPANFKLNKFYIVIRLFHILRMLNSMVLLLRFYPKGAFSKELLKISFLYLLCMKCLNIIIINNF